MAIGRFSNTLESVTDLPVKGFNNLVSILMLVGVASIGVYGVGDGNGVRVGEGVSVGVGDGRFERKVSTRRGVEAMVGKMIGVANERYASAEK
jgi:hypothetical protein